MVEYEILDEHGNQIQINGAEQLKQLAACVNEIRQSDGSIVKEYILNDPKVIEQIRSQMKANPAQAISSSSTSNLTSAPKKPETNFNNQFSNSSSIANNNNLSNKSMYDMQAWSNAPNPIQTSKSATNVLDSSVSMSSKQPLEPPKHKPFESYQPQKTNLNDSLPAPFLSQVQQRIQKFQQQQFANAPSFKSPQQSASPIMSKPIEINRSNESQHMQQQATQYQSLLNQKLQNQSPKPAPAQAKQANEDQLRQTSRNNFELKTSRGKAIQFTITSGDPSESDIEEVKSILNNRNLFCNNNHSTFNPPPLVTSNTNSPKPLASPYLAKAAPNPFPAPGFKQLSSTDPINSSFQPRSLPFNGANETKNGSNNKFTISNNQTNEADRKTANGLGASLFTKSFANLSDDVASNEPKKVNLVENILLSNKNAMMNSPKQSAALNDYSKPIINQNSLERNPNEAQNQVSVVRRSNSFGDSIQNELDATLNSYKNYDVKQEQSATTTTTKSRINGNTYTKSTFNINYQSSVDVKSKPSKPEESKAPNRLNGNLKTTFNKSLNALDDSKNSLSGFDITPEMTEQLLLKFLLQQISNQKLSADKQNGHHHHASAPRHEKRYEDEDDDEEDDEDESRRNDYYHHKKYNKKSSLAKNSGGNESATSSLKKTFLKSESTSPLNTPGVVNSVRKKLFQKSSSNFENLGYGSNNNNNDDYDSTYRDEYESGIGNYNKPKYSNSSSNVYKPLKKRYS
jgi:hypothetical protein